MSLSEICIKRPVFAWVLTLVVVLLGFVTGERLSVRQYPKMSANYITITRDYYGAGPEIIENQITRVTEESVAGIEGIESIESKSDREKSEVVLQIIEDRDLDAAANDIRDRLSKDAINFPNAAQEPILTKAGSNAKQIMNVALVSKKMTDSELYIYASNEVSHAFEAVPGVACVRVYGGGKYKMNISLDPQRMAFYGLTVNEVIGALRKQNIESPAGKIVSKDKEYVVTTVADLQNAEEFNNIPIITKNKNIVRLKDIGYAKLDQSNKDVVSKFNGETVASLSVIAQSSGNPIVIARGVKKKYAEIIKQLPEDVKMFVSYDATTFIERSINEVYRTIFESILLVVLVVLLFLRSFKAALIPLITVPISLIGSLFIMYLFDFTINSMTLMSMVLAIGLVVDDAIVVLENIYKHIEKGLSPFRAAIEGTKEVNFAVIAMTLTLCAVYAPVALAKGTLGMYMKEFSITLAGAVLLSGFVALTLSPMMCSRILGKKDEASKWLNNKFFKSIGKFLKKFDASSLIAKTEEAYARTLTKVLDNRKKVSIYALLFSVFGYFVFVFMPAEQIPYQDQNMFWYDGHAPQSSTMQFTQRYVEAVDKIVGNTSEIESRQYTITNPTVDGFVQLKERCGRKTKDVVAEISKKSREVAGIDLNFSSGGGEGESSNVVSFVLRGNKTHKELRELTTNFCQEMYISKIVDAVRLSGKNEAEDYVIEILRDKASALGVEPTAIADAISGLMQGKISGKFKKDQNVYDVKVEIEEESKRSPDQLSDIYVKAFSEREEMLIPLAELIKVHARSGPISINRYNRARCTYVAGILNDKTSLSESIEVVRDIGKRVLPNGVFLEFIGETKKFLIESSVMFLVFLLALCFIYLVMAAQFESWRAPFIIMLTVPLTLVGGVLTLSCLKGGTINIFSNIGFLTLVGLITKHGILIVDFANKLVEKGLTPRDAIHEAATKRLRPILMTTFAMVLGALPLAFARGAGSEIRVPLGVVIAGGMSVGTMFTIFIVPVFYTYIVKNQSKKQFA